MDAQLRAIPSLWLHLPVQEDRPPILTLYQVVMIFKSTFVSHADAEVLQWASKVGEDREQGFQFDGCP